MILLHDFIETQIQSILIFTGISLILSLTTYKLLVTSKISKPIGITFIIACLTTQITIHYFTYKPDPWIVKQNYYEHHPKDALEDTIETAKIRYLMDHPDATYQPVHYDEIKPYIIINGRQDIPFEELQSKIKNETHESITSLGTYAGNHITFGTGPSVQE